MAECPSLPGCISKGKTRQEAQANIKEAITLYIEVPQTLVGITWEAEEAVTP